MNTKMRKEHFDSFSSTWKGSVRFRLISSESLLSRVFLHSNSNPFWFHTVERILFSAKFDWFYIFYSWMIRWASYTRFNHRKTREGKKSNNENWFSRLSIPIFSIHISTVRIFSVDWNFRVWRNDNQKQIIDILRVDWQKKERAVHWRWMRRRIYWR